VEVRKLSVCSYERHVAYALARAYNNWIADFCVRVRALFPRLGRVDHGCPKIASGIFLPSFGLMQFGLPRYAVRPEWILER
jgi:hypothetical protein